MLTTNNSTCCRTSCTAKRDRCSTYTSTCLRRLSLIGAIYCTAAGQVTVDVLPDGVLLYIFDCYVSRALCDLSRIEWIYAWHTLVHVCRRWRDVVFGSPRRLNMQLYCTARTPVRETMDVWPALPIVIFGDGLSTSTSGADNIIAALQRNDRVCELGLWDVTSSQLEKIAAVMQEPFPVLTSLGLQWHSPIEDTVTSSPPVVPDSFMGGSAPLLRSLHLNRIPFPGLPKLVSSATGLVHLLLSNIPHSGYVSPDALVTCLSALTSLKDLTFEFQSPRSRPDRVRRRPPPPMRRSLPALTRFSFKGVSEYLEDFVARIDTPQLDRLSITFFNQLIFDTPHLSQFISRIPKFQSPDEARTVFRDSVVEVTLPSPTRRFGYEALTLGISSREPDWQLSSLVQLCRTSLPALDTVEDLYIHGGGYMSSRWQNDIENSQWLENFHLFTAAKNLYLSKEFSPRIAPALQELVAGRTTEVLPTLQSLSLEVQPSGPVQEAIGEFFAARQLSGNPIAVTSWERS